MKTTTHITLLLLAALAANAFGGDAKVTLDSSNGSSAFTVRDSASNELARVQSDGKVGIGTTAPAGVFQVNSSSTATDGKVIISSPSSNLSQFQIGNPSGSEASISFIPRVTAFGTTLTSSYGNNALWTLGGGIFGIPASTFGIGNMGAGGSILNIKSTGSVGIGTDTPSVALDVNGSFKASGMPTIICPSTTVTAGNNFPFGASETKTGNISSDASSITIGETGLYLISFTLGFTDLSHGWITVNGAGRLVSWAITEPGNFTTTTVAPLNSEDVIQLFLYQGPFNTTDPANRKFICVTKLH